MKKNFVCKMVCIIIFSFGVITVSAQDQMLGEIKLFAGNFAPRGWAFCQGQLLPISQNAALFSILGTTYGGDGRTTFALPDLRGRVPVGTGQGLGLSNYTLGQKTGAEKVKLSQAQMPVHAHRVENLSEMVIKNSPSDKAGTSLLVTGNPSGSSRVTRVVTSTVGGTQPVNMVQPVLGLNYIIALQGVFPSRN